MAALKVASAAAALSVLVGGGAYFLHHEWRCRALEDDYLNSVSAAKQDVLLKEMVPESRAMAKVSAGLAATEIEGAKLSLSAIYRECGARAGESAFRKGSQLVLGSR